MTVPPKTKDDETPDPTLTFQSTGNAEFDKLIFNLSEDNKDQYVKKLAKLGLELKVPSTATGANETVQTADGNLNITVHLKKPHGHVNYAFFAVTINQPTAAQPTDTNEQSGNTLQYGTFHSASTNTGDPQTCISIRWDPYGRLFDSVSLEPMGYDRLTKEGLKIPVTLLDQDKKKPLIGGLINPQTPEWDGMFNFPVPPGTYYLTIEPPTTHQFIANPHLDPNYSKAYSRLYKPDKPIVEKAGQAKQKDIPLDPGSNTPYKSKIRFMSSPEVVNLGQDTKYEGYVSHPLSKVKFVGLTTGTVYQTVTADEFGYFQLVIPNSNVPSEAIKLVPKKVDITKLASVPGFFPSLASLFQVYAQDTEEGDGDAATIQPVLTFVEGYAYDNTNKVIPNAKVRVKVEWSGQTYYETQADQNGFFRIEPAYLPKFSYYLEFTSPISSVVTVMKTSDFVDKNSQYLSENKINLMAATKNGQSLLPTTPVSPTAAAQPTPIVASSSANLALTFVILLILFGIVGAVLVYIKKKGSMTNLP